MINMKKIFWTISVENNNNAIIGIENPVCTCGPNGE